MSDQQLESAARQYCRLTKQDPDEPVPHSAKPDARGFTPAVLLYSPRWKLVAEILRQHDLMDEAIAWGKTTAI